MVRLLSVVSLWAAASSASASAPAPLSLSVLSWNTHWQCGSDYIKGCRQAAAERLGSMASAHLGPGEVGVARAIVSIEIEATSSTPIDFAVISGLEGGFAQVNGSCPGPPGKTGDALALLLGPELKVLGSDGGCLGGTAGGRYKPDARAFAVALVEPPAATPVAGCPKLCLVGLHSPHVAITEGSDKVAAVCGPARERCTVAMGDWNAPVSSRPFCNFTVADRWRQLMGGTGKVATAAGDITHAVPDRQTCCYPETKYQGWDDHVVTNIPGATDTADVKLGYQMSRFSNDTEEHQPIAVTLVLPVGP